LEKFNNVTTKEVGMKEGKNSLESIFQINQLEMDSFWQAMSTVRINVDVLHQDHVYRRFKERVRSVTGTSAHTQYIGKDRIDLIIMYLTFRTALRLRAEVIRNPHNHGVWKRVRRVEDDFLKLTKEAETVPPDVLTFGFVLHHYWSYLDFVQPGTD
jgi:hypothetical protein